MKAPWIRVAWKGAFAAVYATALTSVVLTSDLYKLLPPIPIPFVPLLLGSSTNFLVALVITCLTLLPFLAKERELPGLLALAGVVVVITSYTYASLDWTRLLKELGITKGGFPPWGILLLCATPFFLALGLQLFENGRLLRENFESRGIPPEDVRGVRHANLHAALETMGLTTGAFLATALGVWLMSFALAGGKLSFGGLATPLLAGALLAVVLAAYLWWPRRHENRETPHPQDGNAPLPPDPLRR